MREMMTMVTLVTYITMVTLITGDEKSHDLCLSGDFCNRLINKAFDGIVTMVTIVTTR